MRGPAAESDAPAGAGSQVIRAEPIPAAGPIAPQPFGPVSRRVVLSLLALVAVYLVVRLRGLVTLLLLSAILAYVLAPVVDGLSRLVFRATRRPLPRWLAILVVFVALATSLAVATVLLLPPLAEQVAALVGQLPKYYEQAANIVADLRRMSRTQLPPEWRQSAEGYLGQLGGVAVRFVQASVGSLFGFVASLAGIVLIPILTYFMLQAAPGMQGRILAWFSPRLRPEVGFLVREVNLVMLKFLRGRLIVAGVIAVLIGAGTWVLGVPYPLVLGLAAGLLDLIPFIGPVLAAIPAVLLTLFDDPSQALWVIGLYVLVQQLEQFVLSPKIEGGELELNPAVVILAATAAGSLFGLLGVLLAVPITALARIGLLYVRAKLRGEPLRSVDEQSDPTGTTGPAT